MHVLTRVHNHIIICTRTHTYTYARVSALKPNLLFQNCDLWWKLLVFSARRSQELSFRRKKEEEKNLIFFLPIANVFKYFRFFSSLRHPVSSTMCAVFIPHQITGVAGPVSLRQL